MHASLRRLPFHRMLTSGGLLLIGMTIVNAGNYLFNLLLGRWLGPAAFADLSLIVTLFLVITFITSALQTIAAKYAAIYTAEETPELLIMLRSWLNRWAWQLGLVMLAIFMLGAPLWSAFFQTHDFWLFVLFAIGIPFYFAQGVDRGMLQGQTRFGALALSYQVEMWVRLTLGLGLVAVGFAVRGGVGALTISILAAWWYARSKAGTPGNASQPIPALSAEQRLQIITFTLPVVLSLIGQILINNSDLLIVKRFFDAETAGTYAALALIGRIIFFATWSVVTTLFPIVAQRHQRGEPHRHLLAIGLVLVGTVSAVLIAATIFLPTLIIQLLFEDAYLGIAPLLWMYAVATALYALANVIITYRLSIGSGFGSVLALIAGCAQVVGLSLVHGSLYEVVLIQIIIMAALLSMLVIAELLTYITAQEFRMSASLLTRFTPIRMLRERPAIAIAACFLIIGLSVGGLLARQTLRADAPQPLLASQQLAQHIASAAQQADGVLVASGAYVPGTGIVLYSQIEREDRSLARAWAANQLFPFADRLAQMPPKEQLTWVIDFSPSAQEIIIAPLARAADASTYSYVSAPDRVDPAHMAIQPTSIATPAATSLPATAPPVATAAPTTEPVATEQPAANGPTVLSSNAFEAGSERWTVLAGSWSVKDGIYVQSDKTGYDYIAVLDSPPLSNFRLSIRLRIDDGEMGGGIIYNMPDPSKRDNAQIIDVTNKGKTLRWGHYQDGGAYQFDGSATIDPAILDGAWHTLEITTRGETTELKLDDTVIGTLKNQSKSGRIGLTTSLAQVSFDDLRLVSEEPTQ